MNLFADIRTLVLTALDTMVAAGDLPRGLLTDNVTVEPPRDAAHGDMATNAAMVLAKPARMKPRDIAEKLAAQLSEDPRITSADVAGPGFLNLRLAPSVWQGVAAAVLNEGTDFGRGTLGAGKRVDVEYVSANPTGPLHVGHTRGAVFGDALASLLAFAGYDVTREYVINDGGSQIDALARSVYLRYLEAHGQEVAFPDGTYPGDYLIAVGQALKDKVGDEYLDKGEQYWLEDIRDFATEQMMQLIRADLKALGVQMDVFYSEKSLYGTGRIEAALADLKSKGLIYEGVLEPPKGKKPEDWEPRPQTLFRATDFGDDVDRPLKKSDGSWTYFASDIAYHFDKYERGFNLMIDVFGADHGGYVKRMKAATKAITGGEGDLDVKLCQLVSLFDKGEPVKMSKRAGTFVTLRDVVERVGKDVVRFIMLTRKNDASLEFDFAKVTEQSKDNPVFYVQYAHARVSSVFRQAAEAFPGQDFSVKTLETADLSLLSSDEEKLLVRRMAEWPRIVEQAATAHEPHRIAFFLTEIAAEFHALWNKGRDNTELRFIIADDLATTLARLAMIRAVATVIASGLDVIGVTPVEEM